MTIYRTGYDTTIGLSLVTKPIEHAIKESIVGYVSPESHLDLISSLNFSPIFISGKTFGDAKIPNFFHPMIIENIKGQNYLCTDIRPFIRNDVQNGYEEGISVRNIAEFSLAKYRMILNLAWVTGHVNMLKTNLSFAGIVFASWLSESISKRFALDPMDQMKLMVIAHFYYQSLFRDTNKIEEDDVQLFAAHTIKATNTSSQFVLGIFDQIDEMGSLEDFCNNVKKILQNIRLKDLNIGIIITIVENSWFGLKAREIIAVALEHPPTWVALVAVGLGDRTYRNMMIARIAERYGKRGHADEFNKNLKELTLMFSQEISQEALQFNTFE